MPKEANITLYTIVLERTIIHLLAKLHERYPELSTSDIIIAALEELLAQNKRERP